MRLSREDRVILRLGDGELVLSPEKSRVSPETGEASPTTPPPLIYKKESAVKTVQIVHQIT